MLLETARLLARRFTPEDAEDLYAVLSDPEVMRYLEPPFSLEQTEEFIPKAGLCDPPLVYAVVWKGETAESVIDGNVGTGIARPRTSNACPYIEFSVPSTAF